VPKRWCLECGQLYDREETGTWRCPTHQAAAGQREKERKRRYEKVRPPRPTTTQRGYGSAYRRERERVLATATSCHWCGEPFTEANPPTADHDPPLAHGGTERQLVAACGRCNSRRGGQTRRR
jgi:5-methylcytosine-specific restriction endonuclease McrA